MNTMRQIHTGFFVLVASVVHAEPEKHQVFTPNDIKWVEGPASLPKGARGKK
jgi:hypothetical protein